VTNQLIQLTLRGPVPRDGAPSADDLRRDYRERHCVTIPGFLDAAFLAWMRAQIANEELTPRTHFGGLATELGTWDSKSVGVLTFLVNDPRVLQFVADLTGQSRLSRFVGRVYHRIPGTHHDSWHDDIHPARLVGMSINLGSSDFQGGEFQIRDTATERPLGQIANTGLGDAILFEIREGLQHRMAPLTGTVPKTAYAGWFGATVDYNAELKHDPTLSAV
jgi:hypothetical protein